MESFYVVWAEKYTATYKNLHELRNGIEGNEKYYYGWVKVRKYNGNTFVELNKCIHKYTFNSDIAEIIRFFKGVTK